jgi:hypothetical protein
MFDRAKASAAGFSDRAHSSGLSDGCTGSPAAFASLMPSPGRHRHSTLSLAAVHSLGVSTVTLLPLLSFAAKMAVSPGAGDALGERGGGRHAGCLALLLAYI